MKIFSLLILCFFMLTFRAFGMFPETEEGRIEQLRGIKQDWQTSRDVFSDIQRQLSLGEIRYGIPLRKYDESIRQPNNNKVVLVSVEDCSKCVKCIFKPRGLLHQKVEQGAFGLSEYLKMKLVPPTVACHFEGQEGILSYYVDTSKDQNFWGNKYKINEIRELVDPQCLNNFYAFSYVFGLWDLKWVNTIMVGGNRPYMMMSLDNESLISPVHASLGEHFFVCWKLDPTCKSSSYQDLVNFESTILKKEEVSNFYASLRRFFILDKSIQDLENEEKKKEVIIKRITSFLWGKELVPHYIGQKGWWLQLYDGFFDIPAPNVTSLTDETQSLFDTLDVPTLKNYFQDSDPHKPLFSADHYENILKRRDLLLKNLKPPKLLPEQGVSASNQ